MKEVKFDKKFLVDKLDLPYNAIEDHVVDNDRWSVHHRIIFEHDGKFYQTYYSVGATEMQDERPWEYETEVECTEVELKEVKVMKWVAAE